MAARAGRPDAARTPPGTAVRGLLAVLALGALALLGERGLEGLLDADRLPLRVVQIEGELRYVDRIDLERAVAEVARGGFFSVDVGAVRSAAEALAWVETAKVRRLWPDTLRVIVEEQRPLGRWTKGRLVNLRGDVFEPGDREPPDLPQLEGPEGSARRVVDTYRAMEARLQPLRMGLARLTLTERQAWSANLSDGTEVLFGTEHLGARLEKLLRAYPVLLRDETAGAVDRVDLRYAHGLAVSRTPPEGESVARRRGRGDPLGAVPRRRA
ncbi:MAG: cell division protein FtsQ/DivIB, partial [Chromatiales bacterium]